MKIKLELEIQDTDIPIIVQSIIETVQERTGQEKSFADKLKDCHF